MFYVTGSTSGVGYDLIDIIVKNNFEAIPIGSRNINNIKNIAGNSNQKGFFVGGDIFDINSDAYNYFMKDIINCSGTIFCLASVDMDAIPKENKDGFIEEDCIDPRDGKEWNNAIRTEDKQLVREEMALKQIEFYKTLFDKLLNRQDTSNKLTIIFANSIISKFYENHSFKHSQYARLKNNITDIIELYRSRLKKNNVFVKNIFLGLIDTPMFRNRGELSAKRTTRIVEKLGVMLPLNGEEIVADTLLKSKDVANFLFTLTDKNPESYPDTYILFRDRHLELDRVLKEEDDKTNILNSKINNLNLLSNDVIFLSEDIKDFLLNLRSGYLDKYLSTKDIPSNRLKKKILSINLSNGDKILQRYPNMINRDTLLDVSIRMISNYP